MIATITGKVAEKLPNILVVEVGGVGYGLLMPLDNYLKLTVGDETKFYIYEHVRENTYDLFGFTELVSKALFEQLIEVNGVGPKVALSILNVATPSELKIAIANGNVKLIQSAAGVGKRVAERIVVDLKNKVGLPSNIDESGLLVSEEAIQQDEAVQALVSLGYTPTDALTALAKVDPKLSTENRVKAALRGQ
ncbi:MAG TPA: Holliday junction branch migration protein RuvA [Candidatus Saccharimonadales bacterium]|nr:Holliday junction branch migration protein RuvA [Candidatus Saccharimonadales bacterium]